MKARKPTEYQECLAYYQWAQLNPITRDYLMKVPNEGKRNPFTGYRLKVIGLRAGIPDYFLPVPNEKYHGLWIEMKMSKRSGIQPNQKEWIEKLKKIGHHACICVGWLEAADVTTRYLNNQI